MKSPKLGSSLLSISPFQLKKTTIDLVQAGIDFIHIDVMDANFVPNLALNCETFKAVKTLTPEMPFDVHFMVSLNALRAIMPGFLSLAPKWMTFHVELDAPWQEFIDQCMKHQVKPGLAINPDTPLEKIRPFLPFCEIVLLMSVPAGYGGQSFRKETYDRLKLLCNWRKQGDNHFLIEVDGGINLPISRELIKLGADLIVIGSDLIAQTQKKEYIGQFHQSIQ